jgi:hypothetical protein
MRVDEMAQKRHKSLGTWEVRRKAQAQAPQVGDWGRVVLRDWLLQRDKASSDQLQGREESR